MRRPLDDLMNEAKRSQSVSDVSPGDLGSRATGASRVSSGIRPRYRLTLHQLAEAVRAEIDLASAAQAPSVARTAAERARELLAALRDRAEALAAQSVPPAASEEGGLDPCAVSRMAGALDALDAYLEALAPETAPRSLDAAAQSATRAPELDELLGRAARPARPTDALGPEYEQVWACAEAARAAVLAAVRATTFDERVRAVRDATDSVDQAREIFDATWPLVRRRLADDVAGEVAEPLERSLVTSLDGLDVVLGALEGSIRRSRR